MRIVAAVQVRLATSVVFRIAVAMTLA